MSRAVGTTRLLDMLLGYDVKPSARFSGSSVWPAQVRVGVVILLMTPVVEGPPVVPRIQGEGRAPPLSASLLEASDPGTCLLLRSAVAPCTHKVWVGLSSS